MTDLRKIKRNIVDAGWKFLWKIESQMLDCRSTFTSRTHRARPKFVEWKDTTIFLRKNAILGKKKKTKIGQTEMKFSCILLKVALSLCISYSQWFILFVCTHINKWLSCTQKGWVSNAIVTKWRTGSSSIGTQFNGSWNAKNFRNWRFGCLCQCIECNK